MAEMGDYAASLGGMQGGYSADDLSAAGFTPMEVTAFTNASRASTAAPIDTAREEELYGTLQEPDYTMRESATARVQNALIEQVGMDPYQAGVYARRIMGDPNAAGILESMGLIDVASMVGGGASLAAKGVGLVGRTLAAAPAALSGLFNVEEGSQATARGYDAGSVLQTGLGALQAAVGVAEMFPAARLISEGIAQTASRMDPNTLFSVFGPPMPARAPKTAPLDVSRRDASNIFGEGSERVRYTDPQSGGTIEVVVRPDGSASVLELEVPEGFRGQGIGQRLQERVMQDFPMMGGQVSSKAAATTAYRLGRRPPGKPDATLEEVFADIDEMSSVNMVSPAMQKRIAPSAPSLPAPRNEAEAMARDILQLRAEGRADEVTEEMMAAADPQYMYFNTPLPMDYESRMARANQYFPDTAYHSTGRDFQEFVPSEFRGASFFGPTPEGAARGASASANEGVGSGSTLTMPVRVDTSRVEGLGAYGRQDMNEFRASLPDRVYTEAEVDALMASDMAPRYGNWTYFFDDLTDYDALSKFRDANPDAPIPEGIIKYRPKQPLSYGPGLRSDISGKQFAHYSEGMSERPISDYTKSIGNTGFTMMDESGLALAMTDPTRIRSRFARFDPEFRNLRNLSAGIGGAAVLTALAEDAEAGAPEMQIMGLVQQSGITGAAEALGVSPRDIEEAIAIAVPPSQWEQLVVGPR